jgi:hypothetical protein
VVAAPATVVYRPAAPVVTYSPVTTFSPVPVTTYSPVVTYRAPVYSVVVRPRYVPGQPVRNFFRAWGP